MKRNGGNVASYFCTPSGRVIHAVTGPVGASSLLNEAQWAVDQYHTATTAAARETDVAAQLAESHRQSRQLADNGQLQQIHQLLAENPLPPLQAVFQTVFERILGEKVSLPGQGVEAVVEAIRTAKERQLPILFVLSRNKTQRAPLEEWNQFVANNQTADDSTMQELVDSYVVVGLPLDLMPAVSAQSGIRPFAAPNQSSQLLVVTRSDGRQLLAQAGWNRPASVKQMLVQGLVQEAKEHTRTSEQLKQLLSLATQVDPQSKKEVERLIAPKPLLPGPRPGSRTVASR